MVGLTWHASQVCCSQSPFPRDRPLLTCASTGDIQSLKGRSCSVSCGVPGSWCTQGFVWALLASLAGVRFNSKHDSVPSTLLLGLLLCPWMWGIFFGGIQHSPVDGCSVVSCNFGVLAGEDEHMFFYSAILLVQHKSHKSELLSSSSISAIRVVSSAYLRLLIFLPAILVPACASSN